MGALPVGGDILNVELAPIGADGEVEQISGYAYDGVRLSRFDERTADGTGVSTEYTYTPAGYLERAAQTRLEDPSAVDEVRNFTHYCRDAY